MITGMRGVVLLDNDDAAYLVDTLRHDFAMLAGHGLRPSARVAALHGNLARAVASASDSTRNACAGVRLIGGQPDSEHAAFYDLVDTREAAGILGCTAANVRDLGRRGRLPRHRAGRGWVYPARSVVELAERRAAKRG